MEEVNRREFLEVSAGAALAAGLAAGCASMQTRPFALAKHTPLAEYSRSPRASR